ncbi:MAG TPA: HEPN domain-containing protein, partial [Spirochaetota bacterium]|nr:HEPN domain-containing protein [Spirochaetota bacterium]
MVIQELVDKWIAIADKDLLTAELLLKSDVVVTETICYHCQQSVEKYLKAYLVK